MTLPAEPLPATEVLERLSAMRAGDPPIHGGRVLAYVFDSGVAGLADVAGQALQMYAGVNMLDPTVFPSVAMLENDLVGYGLGLLGGGPASAGVVTSGGTESCLLAVKTARDAWRARGGEGTPVLVMPVTGHPAFVKAAHYFGLERRVLPVDVSDFRVRTSDVAAALDDLGERVALVVVSAPSYAHGVVDPVREVAALAAERGVPCHSDACIGGWTLPYLRRLGRPIPDFDLSVPGVSSLSADLHKYGYAPKGTSLLLFADASYRRHLFFASSEWPGYPVVNSTMQSTKSAGPAAAAWAVLRAVGDDGFAELVRATAEATDRIVAGVAELPGLRVLGRPDATLVAVAADGGPDDGGVDPFVLADEMTERGWFVQPQPAVGELPRNVHLTVQAASLATVEGFLTDLRAAADAARALPWAVPDPQLAALAASLDPDTLDDATVSGLLAFAGLGGEHGPALPKRSASIQALLEALPPRLKDRLLTGFFSQVFTASR
jgi:glutamate/tyrosine decarboxylase-like PLP-dependent enzyme